MIRSTDWIFFSRDNDDNLLLSIVASIVVSLGTSNRRWLFVLTLCFEAEAHFSSQMLPFSTKADAEKDSNCCWCSRCPGCCHKGALRHTYYHVTLVEINPPALLKLLCLSGWMLFPGQQFLLHLGRLQNTSLSSPVSYRFLNRQMDSWHVNLFWWC